MVNNRQTRTLLPRWLGRLSRSKSPSPNPLPLQPAHVEVANKSPAVTNTHLSRRDNDGETIVVAAVNNQSITDQSAPPILASNPQPRTYKTTSNDPMITNEQSDIWSRAYREAVSNLGEDVQSKIPTAETIEELLCELDKTNQELACNSLFRKGLKQLRGPLQGLKLALDVTQPLSSAVAGAQTAVGMVSGVTAIAIAVCGAEETFNDKVVEMLRQVPVIDECDLLGQKLGPESGVYKGLIPVYQDLLEFYIAASKILTSKAFVLAILRDQLNGCLPLIVDNFLLHAGSLRSRIENATLDLVEQIQKQLLDDKIQKILGIEKEKQRSDFHCHIRDEKAEGTCEWLVTDEKFLQWYNASGSDKFVLFGSTGCGKTYTTGHVVEKVIALRTYQLPRSLVCYHYCSDKETGNAVYIYSSLILQLLDQRKSLKVGFDQWYQNTKIQELSDPGRYSKALKSFLALCVDDLDRQLFVIIDGLDECDADSQKDIVTFFSTLSTTVPRLKIFLSSRPTEALKHLLHAWTCVYLDANQERDHRIAQHAIKKHLYYVQSDAQEKLLQTLSSLATGNAQWIKIIVDLVAAKHITTLKGMEAFLLNLPNPTELSKLYAKAFRQATAGDIEHEQLATSALEILAVAYRPLSILELSAAVALSLFGEELHSIDGLQTLMDERQDLIDTRRVLTLLQPFVLPIESTDMKKRQIKLGHHSLRELIWKAEPSDWEHLNSATRLSDKPVKIRRAKLEANILRICVKYLLFDEIDLLDLIPEEFSAALEWQELPEGDLFDDFNSLPDQGNCLPRSMAGGDTEETKIILFDPANDGFGDLFVYASCFWCDHSRIAAPELLPAIEDIVRLCRAGSKRLQNWTRQRLYPECSLRPTSDWENRSFDPLLILSLFGPQTALQSLLRQCDVSGPDFLHDSLQRTLDELGARGDDLSRFGVIFQHRDPALDFPNFDFLYSLMHAWERLEETSGQETKCFDIIYNMFDVIVEKKWGTSLLCAAVRFNCLPVITILLQEASRNQALRSEMLEHSKLSSTTRNYKSFMLEAIQSSNCETLEYLLQQHGTEDDLRRTDEKARNIFHEATLWGNPRKMALLIQHWSAGAHEFDTNRETPLKIAVFGNRMEATKQLLESAGVDVRSGRTGEKSHYEEPLRTAIRARNTAMCRLLVEVGGADPHSAMEIGTDGSISLLDSGEAASPILELLCSLGSISRPSNTAQ